MAKGNWSSREVISWRQFLIGFTLRWIFSSILGWYHGNCFIHSIYMYKRCVSFLKGDVTIRKRSDRSKAIDIYFSKRQVKRLRWASPRCCSFYWQDRNRQRIGPDIQLPFGRRCKWPTCSRCWYHLRNETNSLMSYFSSGRETGESLALRQLKKKQVLPQLMDPLVAIDQE